MYRNAALDKGILYIYNLIRLTTKWGITVNYIICDDEPRAAGALKGKIAELEPEASVRIFSSPRALLFNIEDIADRIDGIFLNVKQVSEIGLSGVEQLLYSQSGIKLVYIADCVSAYIQELYCVSTRALPAAILIKPIQMKYLLNALAKIHENEKHTQLIPVRIGCTVKYLKTAEIISVTSTKRKLVITSADGICEIYGKISDFCTKLPGCFVQCHKSCIINLNKIIRINRWTSLELSDGSVFPISRTYKDSIKTAVSVMN